MTGPWRGRGLHGPVSFVRNKVRCGSLVTYMPNDIVTPTVELVGFTEFRLPESLRGTYRPDDEWWLADLEEEELDYSGGQHLAEFAGRACYQSWTKPNPATATNAGYLQHILDVNHGSVLEHGSISFYICGVSRSLTHELVRHRPGMAYSQLSQRYVAAEDSGIVVPPELRDVPGAEYELREAMRAAVGVYNRLYESMAAILESEGVEGTEARKRARQAARAVMPNMTETRIVVTGNLRAWRHFLTVRAASPADHEIREVAMMIYDELIAKVPNAVQDFMPVTLHDGTRALELEQA